MSTSFISGTVNTHRQPPTQVNNFFSIDLDSEIIEHKKRISTYLFLQRLQLMLSGLLNGCSVQIDSQ